MGKHMDFNRSDKGLIVISGWQDLSISKLVFILCVPYLQQSSSFRIDQKKDLTTKSSLTKARSILGAIPDSCLPTTVPKKNRGRNSGTLYGWIESYVKKQGIICVNR